MATNIIVAKVTPTAVGLDCSIAWIGDVSAWILVEGTWQHTAGDVDPTAKTGLTRAIPSDVCAPLERRVESSNPIFLVTDGISDLLWPDSSTAKALAEWWKSPPDPYEFLTQMALRNRGKLDDRTAVGIWPTCRVNDR